MPQCAPPRKLRARPQLPSSVPFRQFRFVVLKGRFTFPPKGGGEVFLSRSTFYILLPLFLSRWGGSKGGINHYFKRRYFEKTKPSLQMTQMMQPSCHAPVPPMLSLDLNNALYGEPVECVTTPTPAHSQLSRRTSGCPPPGLRAPIPLRSPSFTRLDCAATQLGEEVQSIVMRKTISESDITGDASPSPGISPRDPHLSLSSAESINLNIAREFDRTGANAPRPQGGLQRHGSYRTSLPRQGSSLTQFGASPMTERIPLPPPRD